MNTFVNSIKNQGARTDNGMRARKSTASANVDLFFKIGASRGKDITADFVAAFVENEDYALRIAQWARDVRGGAGERQLFKDILAYLEKTDPESAKALIRKIPTIGRWDDMLINYTNTAVQTFAFEVYGKAIKSGDGLAAKWAPRKGAFARLLRTAWGMTPKQYRKTLVTLSNTVETLMCEKRWNSIDYGKIPSLAHARYKSAFYKNAAESYQAFVDQLKAGTAKINAGAVYPYDVLKGFVTSYGAPRKSQTEIDAMIAQWNAMPNFMGDANVFPMVDVSGSMTCPVGGNANLTCLQVAISLGLYCADKNTGKFKDAFLTFSGRPEIMHLRGNIMNKIDQMAHSNWDTNTNLHAAFEAMLQMAVKGRVPASEMPRTLLIFSDMQFDRCARYDDTAIQMIERKYANAGYEMPNVVFWNLNARDNVPVSFNRQGVALVSGFSPAIMKSIIAGKDFTPKGIMLDTIMDSRYDLLGR